MFSRLLIIISVVVMVLCVVPIMLLRNLIGAIPGRQGCIRGNSTWQKSSSSKSDKFKSVWVLLVSLCLWPLKFSLFIKSVEDLVVGKMLRRKTATHSDKSEDISPFIYQMH